jgi:hypothetical protein
MLNDRQAAVLAWLLILDGDQGVRMIPDPAGTRARLARDAAEGVLPPDVDGDGVHAAFASLICGYMVLRDQVASELVLDRDELDEKAGTMINRLMRRSRCAVRAPEDRSHVVTQP